MIIIPITDLSRSMPSVFCAFKECKRMFSNLITMISKTLIENIANRMYLANITRTRAQLVVRFSDFFSRSAKVDECNDFEHIW